jgi:hypothetical protein
LVDGKDAGIVEIGLTAGPRAFQICPVERRFKPENRVAALPHIPDLTAGNRAGSIDAIRACRIDAGNIVGVKEAATDVGGAKAGICSSPRATAVNAVVKAASVGNWVHHRRRLRISAGRQIRGRRCTHAEDCANRNRR